MTIPELALLIMRLLYIYVFAAILLNETWSKYLSNLFGE